jgi:hypothetical protein
MRSIRSLCALLLLASTSGCYQAYQGYQVSYIPNAGNWNAAAIEHPQRVRFYYGYIVNARYVPVEYANRWVVPRWQPAGRWVTDAVEPWDADPDPDARALPQPNLSAIEYTVMLDNSTVPPDRFLQPDQRPAIVVVQHI